MFSLESPYRGDSNECTQHAIISIKITLNYPKYNIITSAAMDFFPSGLKNEFEKAVVIEPLVFEP